MREDWVIVKVVIVDDEVMERELLGVLCRDVSPSVEVVADCADGRQGLQAVSKHHPDLVFLDVQMPMMDGIHTARVLRENWPYLPVVIVSAHDKFEYARDAIDLGVLSYLLKPVSPEDLAGVFQRLARSFGRNESARNRQENETESGLRQGDSRGRGQGQSREPWQGQRVGLPGRDDGRRLQPEPTASDSLTKVLQYIDAHVEDELSLRTLAAAAGFHPVHLSRSFKKEFGIGLSDYISKIRLQKAQALLLQSPGLTIQEVALAVGFNSQHYFASVFRNEMNCSPSEFRHQYTKRLKNQNNTLRN